MEKSRKLALILGLYLGATSLVCFASANEPSIGRITYLDKKFWNIKINGNQSAEFANKIQEGDVIQTISGQQLTIEMNDGSELMIGPGSRVAFTNWTHRDSENHLVRVITLTTGFLKAKVRKVYSQVEPFVVAHKYGVASVRGTEFVVESGPAGRLERARKLTPKEMYARRFEVELHTLEGEVQFAKTMEDLKSDDKRLSVMAGETSVIRFGMTEPQGKHGFALEEYRSYIAYAMPRLPVNIVKNTTNEERAEIASNSKNISATSNRAIATGSIAKMKLNTPVSRRAILMGERKVVAPRRDVGSRGLSSDLVRDAFSGGEGGRGQHEDASLSNAQTTRMGVNGGRNIAPVRTDSQLQHAVAPPEAPKFQTPR